MFKWLKFYLMATETLNPQISPLMFYDWHNIIIITNYSGGSVPLGHFSYGRGGEGHAEPCPPDYLNFFRIASLSLTLFMYIRKPKNLSPNCVKIFRPQTP